MGNSNSIHHEYLDENNNVYFYELEKRNEKLSNFKPKVVGRTFENSNNNTNKSPKKTNRNNNSNNKSNVINDNNGDDNNNDDGMANNDTSTSNRRRRSNDFLEEELDNFRFNALTDYKADGDHNISKREFTVVKYGNRKATTVKTTKRGSKVFLSPLLPRRNSNDMDNNSNSKPIPKLSPPPKDFLYSCENLLKSNNNKMKATNSIPTNNSISGHSTTDDETSTSSSNMENYFMDKNNSNDHQQHENDDVDNDNFNPNGVIYCNVNRNAKVTCIALSSSSSSATVHDDDSSTTATMMAIGTDDGRVAIMEILNDDYDGSSHTDGNKNNSNDDDTTNNNSRTRMVCELNREGKVRTLDFSSSCNGMPGKWLCVGGDDCTINLYKLHYNDDDNDNNNEQPRKPLGRCCCTKVEPMIHAKFERSDRIYSAKFNNDNTMIAIGGYDGSVAIVSVHTATAATTTTNNDDEDSCNIVDDDDDDNDNKIEEDVVTNLELVTELQPGEGLVFTLDWSANGKMLALGGNDKYCVVYGTTSWNMLGDIKRPSSIRTVKFNRSCDKLSIGCSDGSICIIDIIDQCIIAEFSSLSSPSGQHDQYHQEQLQGEEDCDGGSKTNCNSSNCNSNDNSAIGTSAYHRHPKMITTPSKDDDDDDEALDYYDHGGSSRSGITMGGKSDVASCLSFGDATCSSLKSTSQTTNNCTRGTTNSRAYYHRVNSMCWCPNDSFLAVGGSDDTCTLIETSSYTIVHKIHRKGHINCLDWVQYSNNSKDRFHQPQVVADQSTISSSNQADPSSTTTTVKSGGCYLAIGGDDKSVALLKTHGYANNFHTSDKTLWDDDGSDTAISCQDNKNSNMPSSPPRTEYNWVIKDDFDDIEDDNSNELGNVPSSDHNEQGQPNKGDGISITAIAFSRRQSSKESSRSIRSSKSPTLQQNYMAIASSSGSVIVLDTKRNWSVGTRLNFKKKIRAVSFSRKNEYVALGGDDQTLYIVSIKSNWQLVKEIPTQHKIYALVFNNSKPHGNNNQNVNDRLAIGLSNGKVLFVEQELQKQDDRGRWEITSEIDTEKEVKILSIDWYKNYLAVGRDDGVVIVYDTSTTTDGIPKKLAALERRCRNSKAVYSVSFGIKGKYLCVGGADRKVAIYSEKGNWVLCHEIRMSHTVTAVKWNNTTSNGKYLAYGGKDTRKGAVIVDTESWSEIKFGKNSNSADKGIGGMGGTIKGITWSFDDRYVVMAGSDGVANIIETDNWNVIHSIKHNGKKMTSYTKASPSQTLSPSRPSFDRHSTPRITNSCEKYTSKDRLNVLEPTSEENPVQSATTEKIEEGENTSTIDDKPPYSTGEPSSSPVVRGDDLNATTSTRISGMTKSSEITETSSISFDYLPTSVRSGEEQSKHSLPSKDQSEALTASSEARNSCNDDQSKNTVSSIEQSEDLNATIRTRSSAATTNRSSSYSPNPNIKVSNSRQHNVDELPSKNQIEYVTVPTTTGNKSSSVVTKSSISSDPVQPLAVDFDEQSKNTLTSKEQVAIHVRQFIVEFLEAANDFLVKYEEEDAPEPFSMYIPCILMLENHFVWVSTQDQMHINEISDLHYGEPLHILFDVLDVAVEVMTQVVDNENESNKVNKSFEWLESTPKFDLSKKDIRRINAWNEYWLEIDENVPIVETGLLRNADQVVNNTIEAD